MRTCTALRARLAWQYVRIRTHVLIYILKAKLAILQRPQVRTCVQMPAGAPCAAHFQVAIYNALAATQVLDRPQVRTYVLGADGTQSREPLAGQ